MIIKWTLEAEIEETIDDNGEVVQPDEIARFLRGAMPEGVRIIAIRMHQIVNDSKDSN